MVQKVFPEFKDYLVQLDYTVTVVYQEIQESMLSKVAVEKLVHKVQPENLVLLVQSVSQVFKDHLVIKENVV